MSASKDTIAQLGQDIMDTLHEMDDVNTTFRLSPRIGRWDEDANKNSRVHVLLLSQFELKDADVHAIKGVMKDSDIHVSYYSYYCVRNTNWKECSYGPHKIISKTSVKPPWDEWMNRFAKLMHPLPYMIVILQDRDNDTFLGSRLRGLGNVGKNPIYIPSPRQAVWRRGGGNQSPEEIDMDKKLALATFRDAWEEKVAGALKEKYLIGAKRNADNLLPDGRVNAFKFLRPPPTKKARIAVPSVVHDDTVHDDTIHDDTVDAVGVSGKQEEE